MWHYHMYGMYEFSFDQKPEDLTGETSPMNKDFIKTLADEHKPTRPAKDGGWWYAPHMTAEYVPEPPKPYETWSDVTDPY